jgi:DNA-directed RNA polymerase subunit RPC12/RpoP
MMETEATNQQVPFRLFFMPCCKFNCCWVNPRLPNYCPECGERVFMKLRVGDCTMVDSPAWLRIENPNPKEMVT